MRSVAAVCGADSWADSRDDTVVVAGYVALQRREERG